MFSGTQRTRHRRPSTAASRHRQLRALARRGAANVAAARADPRGSARDRALSRSRFVGVSCGQEVWRASCDGAASTSLGTESLAERSRKSRTAHACAGSHLTIAQEARMKYVLVFYGGGMPDTPAAQARVLKQWSRWHQELSKSGIDVGLPLSCRRNR